MTIDDLMDLEFDHSVCDILMMYFNCDSDEDLEDEINYDDSGYVECWADLNDVSTSKMKRIIIDSLDQQADFTVVSHTDDSAECKLELDDATIDITWDLE